MKKRYILAMLCGLFLVYNKGFGQLNPLGSMYYQNEYLNNPSLAGMNNTVKLNAAFRAQWTNIEGAPLTQVLTADYGASNKVGLGTIFYLEQSGVFQRKKAMISYAYHLPLNDDVSKLNFGLSAGIMNEWINRSKVVGEQSDVNIAEFNERPTYLDADFGASITTEKLLVAVSMPNLKRFFKRDVLRNSVDLSTFFATAGYKIAFQNSLDLDNIEPKVTYRTVQGYKDIIDFGTQLNFSEKKLMINSLYRTTGSFTLGMGTTYRNSLSVLALYTTNTSALRAYTNAEFEVALKYTIQTKK